jgi:hypothetical protein
LSDSAENPGNGLWAASGGLFFGKRKGLRVMRVPTNSTSCEKIQTTTGFKRLGENSVTAESAKRTPENSPAIYRWENIDPSTQSAKRTAEM